MNKKCKYCGKTKGEHQAKTLNYPMGSKTRIGYIHFDSQSVFEWDGKVVKTKHITL